MAFFWDAYAGATAYQEPRLSPLAADDLAGLSPAVVVTAGFDPLRDDGAHYAERLRAARVPVRYLEFGTLIHAFAEFPGRVPAAQAAIDEFLTAFADLRDAAVRPQAV